LASKNTAIVRPRSNGFHRQKARWAIASARYAAIFAATEHGKMTTVALAPQNG